MKYLLSVFFLTLSLYAQTEEPAYQIVEDLSTPSDFSYRKVGKILLENGLQVYLISDPYVQQSAAALAVETGSWSDPQEYPGMAHFIEHLLFLGTKAYPKESEYRQFIQDHGGKENAFTSSDRTVYIFSSDTDAYAQALDRFSHFFIDPLFSTSSVSRELHAIDQEYAKDKENEGWRLQMIVKETGNPFHPNHQFSCGNQATLSKIPLVDLQNWYAKHYIANRMHLVMLSSLPLAEMKDLVVKNFSAIKSATHLEETQKGPLFSAKQKGHMTFIKPIKDLKQLSLKWEIPQEFTRLEEKLPEFLVYVLQKQTKGSLFAKLKQENLIESLSVYKDSYSKENQLFCIDLFLTNQGLIEKDTVISYVFAALKRMKSELLAPLFEEFKIINTLYHTRESMDNVFERVSQFASNMIYENLSTYPNNTRIPSLFHVQKFHSFINALTPSSCAYFLVADPSRTGVVPNQKERWMQVEYTIVPNSSKQLKSWKNMSVHPEITLPEANPYLLVSKNTPTIIHQDEGSLVYFNRTHTTSNELIFQYKTPCIDDTPKTQVLAELWIYALKNMLADELSFASDAGIAVDIGFSSLDLHLGVYGINEKVFPLTKKIFHALKQVDCPQEKFPIYVQSLVTQYENSSKELPIEQAKAEMKNMFYDNSSIEQKLFALKNVTWKDLCDFSEQFSQSLYVQAFFYVDLSQTQARELLQELQAILGAKPYPVNQHSKIKVLVLPRPSSPSKLIFNTQQQGAAATLLLQQGPFSFASRSVQKILSSALDSAFFEALRTQQKTAYITQVIDIEEEGQLMQFFGVQSSTHVANDLLARFELFIKDFDKNLESEIPLERFEQIRASIIHSLESAENKSSLSIFSLAFYYQDFDWIKKLISALQALSYDQFCTVAHQMLSQDTPRIAILVEGEMPTEDINPYKEFSSKEDIKKMGEFVSR